MRVSLTGFLKNVADEMQEMANAIREKAGWTEESGEDDPSPEADWMIGQLREIAKHAAGVASGEHSLEEFANHYDLKT